ncbi:DUF998 domain-containing protein [Lentzea nigeriaca]|uniref:DUF998 domain-containing protein n=1 Tax=Lentzea nigeriaca TaxID=1128665 RepID=UPI00195870C0|nr:DUF998 domain-containing protein [Lentzea nigeriaca]MBM7864221.1 hypothetical protein [Lentzea nigeriaca]
MDHENQHAASRTWLIAAALLYSCWLLELVLPTGLSMVDSYVSELLADDQPFRWLFRTTDALAAVCLLFAARELRGRAGVARLPATGRPLALLRALLTNRSLPALLLIAFAAATLADTALSLDCAASVDALCHYRENTGAVSLGHRLHQVTSALTFVSALLAAVRLRNAWVVGLLLTTGALSVVLANQPGAGLVQRVQLLTIAAGLLLAARVPRHVVTAG